MLPMMVMSAVKANVKEEKPSSKSVNPQLEELQQKCYEELFELLTIVAEQTNTRMTAILPMQVRELQILKLYACRGACTRTL